MLLLATALLSSCSLGDKRAQRGVGGPTTPIRSDGATLLVVGSVGGGMLPMDPGQYRRPDIAIFSDGLAIVRTPQYPLVGSRIEYFEFQLPNARAVAITALLDDASWSHTATELAAMARPRDAPVRTLRIAASAGDVTLTFPAGGAPPGPVRVLDELVDAIRASAVRTGIRRLEPSRPLLQLA